MKTNLKRLFGLNFILNYRYFHRYKINDEQFDNWVKNKSKKAEYTCISIDWFHKVVYKTGDKKPVIIYDKVKQLIYSDDIIIS